MRVYLLGFFSAGAFADDLIRIITADLFRDAAGESPLDVLDRQSRPHPRAGPEVAEFFNREADLVVFCGGSLLGRLRLSPFDSIETWADKLAVPLVILGTGWREEAEPLTVTERMRMRLLLDRADAAYVRGRDTLGHIRRAGLPAGGIVPLGDPGLCRTNRYTRQVARRKPRVGVVVRDMTAVERRQDLGTIDNGAFHAQMAGVLDWLVKDHGATIIWFPMTPEGRADNDWAGCRAVQARMATLDGTLRVYHDGLDGPYHEPGVLAAMLGQMDLVISQRLHGTLVSLAQGVPAVPIEYQFGKMADSLSVPGCSHLRSAILPMAGLSVPAVAGRLGMLRSADTLAQTVATCRRVRAGYVAAIRAAMPS